MDNNLSSIETPLALDNDLHFLIAKVRTRGLSQVNEQLEPFDLKVSSYAVLSVASSGRRFTQTALATFLSLDPSHIVTLVDKLEARGLVERLPDPGDRRARIVVATDEGRRLDAQARERVTAAEETAMGALSPDERKTLKHLLKLMAQEEDISPVVD